MTPLGPGPLARVGRWQQNWHRHDLDQAHSQLGPLVVDTSLQGCGIGSKLLREYTSQLDATGQCSYLETDKPENTAIYRRHGFVVVTEADVLGTPNWFMQRIPHNGPLA